MNSKTVDKKADSDRKADLAGMAADLDADEALRADTLAAIRVLRDRVRHVDGCLVASVDGQLIAHDTHGVEPDGMAALSAAVLGLSQRLILTVGYDDFAETVTRGDSGYVATYAAGPDAVLTVMADGAVNVGRLHLEARRVATGIAVLFRRRAEGVVG